MATVNGSSQITISYPAKASSGAGIMSANKQQQQQEECTGSGRDDESNGDCTRDGSLDRFGRPARRDRTGGWRSGFLLLVNQGLSTLAFVGVEVNLVLFSKRVLNQSNTGAANTFSRWMGTVHFFSLLGAFLSDSYLGRFKTCVIFQVVLVVGLTAMSLTTSFLLLNPYGCGKRGFHCTTTSPLPTIAFYLSIYLLALGNGAYEPSLAALGSDQFEEEHAKEGRSKESFYSYYYISTNLGSMFSETVLAYVQDSGHWAPAFWVSTASALIAYTLFLGGSDRYRRFRPCGNPLSRFCQVVFAACRKSNIDIPDDGVDGLYEVAGSGVVLNGGRKILHTKGFRFLDRAAVLTPRDAVMGPGKSSAWRLCTITQVEEVKCLLRLIPLWLCTIFFSTVFVQMTPLFLEQGAAMRTDVGATGFRIPPASMTVFDIVSVSAFILLYDKFAAPIFARLGRRPRAPRGLTDLQKMGLGLAVAGAAMVTAGLVEIHRRAYSTASGGSTLSILWQVPQYVILGVAEALIYVGQYDFFGSQAPHGLKSLGIGLCMSSASIGSYFCSLLLSAVKAVTTKGGRPGWIPNDLNEGRLERFFFLMAGFTAVELLVYVFCSTRYKSVTETKSPASEVLRMESNSVAVDP